MLSAVRTQRAWRSGAAHRRSAMTRVAYLPRPAVRAAVPHCAAVCGQHPSGLEPLDGSYESKHAFSSYANWLVPGKVMLGRYPYVEPSRCPNAEQGQAQMAAIMDAGITTFVCLQDELPPQESFPEGGQDRPSGKFLPYRSIAQATKPDTVFLYTPIVDLGTPSHGLLEKLLVDLRERLAAGQVLYIHCWGGRGRAGTVGSTLLVSGFGVEVEEALERVQRAYSTRNDDSPMSPETPEQFEFIRAYATQFDTAK